MTALTPLIIQAATWLQRREIEEELRRQRIQRACFQALALRVPDALLVISSSSSNPDGPVSLLQSPSPGALDSQTSVVRQQCNGTDLNSSSDRPVGVQPGNDKDEDIPAHWREAFAKPRLTAEEANKFPGGRW